jgi:signal transduction histidine kinase
VSSVRIESGRPGRVSRWAVPAGCALLLVTALVMQRVVVRPSDVTYRFMHSNGVLAALIAGGLAGCAVLLWRRERPLVVLGVESLLALAAGPLGLDSFAAPLLLIAYWSVVLASSGLVTVLSGVWTAAVMLGPVVLAAPANPLLESLPRVVPVLLVGVVAVAVRARREVTGARERELAEQRRAAVLAGQRDAARRRSRIAGELHDSVGHGLTTIIALSQGIEERLGGTTGDPDADRALAAIIGVAKDSLDDTRTALRALAATDEGDASSSPSLTPPERTWEDIRPVLDAARAAGCVVTLTETGRHPDDARQAELCFSVTREAVTNALRHGVAVTRIGVAWDHARDGSVTAVITNDGEVAGAAQPWTARPSAGGTGLRRLSRSLREAGGSLSAEPSPLDGAGWQVRAVIPALSLEADAR